MNLETEFRIYLQLTRLACPQSESLLCDRPLTEGKPWEITWNTEADWETNLELETDLEINLETEWDSEPKWNDPSRSQLPAWVQPDPISSPLSIPSYGPPNTLPPSSWVQLVQPSPLFGGHEAMLLCQIAPCQWLAWMPEYGELILGREEFYWDSEPD